MRYSTVPSSQELRAAGLPVSVVELDPRTTLAAFASEDMAMKFADVLNGKREIRQVTTAEVRSPVSSSVKSASDTLKTLSQAAEVKKS